MSSKLKYEWYTDLAKQLADCLLSLPKDSQAIYTTTGILSWLILIETSLILNSTIYLSIYLATTHLWDLCLFKKKRFLFVWREQSWRVYSRWRWTWILVSGGKQMNDSERRTLRPWGTWEKDYKRVGYVGYVTRLEWLEKPCLLKNGCLKKSFGNILGSRDVENIHYI
jgi:hypothetical protein